MAKIIIPSTPRDCSARRRLSKKHKRGDEGEKTCENGSSSPSFSRGTTPTSANALKQARRLKREQPKAPSRSPSVSNNPPIVVGRSLSSALPNNPQESESNDTYITARSSPDAVRSTQNEESTPRVLKLSDSEEEGREDPEIISISSTTSRAAEPAGGEGEGREDPEVISISSTTSKPDQTPQREASVIERPDSPSQWSDTIFVKSPWSPSPTPTPSTTKQSTPQTSMLTSRGKLSRKQAAKASKASARRQKKVEKSGKTEESEEAEESTLSQSMSNLSVMRGSSVDEPLPLDKLTDTQKDRVVKFAWTISTLIGTYYRRECSIDKLPGSKLLKTAKQLNVNTTLKQADEVRYLVFREFINKQYPQGPGVGPHRINENILHPKYLEKMDEVMKDTAEGIKRRLEKIKLDTFGLKVKLAARLAVWDVEKGWGFEKPGKVF